MSTTPATDLFSNSYAEAASRIRDAAARIDAQVWSYPITVEGDNSLSLDVIAWGPEDAPIVLSSSGVHGVEGFFGSAIQLAHLQAQVDSAPARIRHVLIHAVNPFGFAKVRRFNEDNVDLNRNFHDRADDYAGAPDAYRRLNSLLNPTTAPSRIEPFYLIAMWRILRDGLQTLKQAVAGGQYEYPQGLFFGGKHACKSTQIVLEHSDAWLTGEHPILHIDFHSGLGRWAEYKLLLSGEEEDDFDWYSQAFGSDSVEPPDANQQTAYRVSGLFGGWFLRRYRQRGYRFVAAEFGTYGPLRVLQSLRNENRVHHYCDAQDAIHQASKTELLECFCPSSSVWRERVVHSGLRILEHGVKALTDDFDAARQ